MVRDTVTVMFDSELNSNNAQQLHAISVTKILFKVLTVKCTKSVNWWMPTGKVLTFQLCCTHVVILPNVSVMFLGCHGVFL